MPALYPVLYRTQEDVYIMRHYSAFKLLMGHLGKEGLAEQGQCLSAVPPGSKPTQTWSRHLPMPPTTLAKHQGPAQKKGEVSGCAHSERFLLNHYPAFCGPYFYPGCPMTIIKVLLPIRHFGNLSNTTMGIQGTLPKSRQKQGKLLPERMGAAA